MSKKVQLTSISIRSNKLEDFFSSLEVLRHKFQLDFTLAISCTHLRFLREFDQISCQHFKQRNDLRSAKSFSQTLHSNLMKMFMLSLTFCYIRVSVSQDWFVGTWHCHLLRTSTIGCIKSEMLNERFVTVMAEPILHIFPACNLSTWWFSSSQSLIESHRPVSFSEDSKL